MGREASQPAGQLPLGPGEMTVSPQFLTEQQRGAAPAGRGPVVSVSSDHSAPKSLTTGHLEGPGSPEVRTQEPHSPYGDSGDPRCGLRDTPRGSVPQGPLVTRAACRDSGC